MKRPVTHPRYHLAKLQLLLELQIVNGYFSESIAYALGSLEGVTGITRRDYAPLVEDMKVQLLYRPKENRG